MKIISIKDFNIPDVKIIRFARFCDQRGYFSESFRDSDFYNNPEMEFMKGMAFVQMNESYSRLLTIRGLHFQWNPFMGKLVRTLRGRMVDLMLDIRKGSSTFGMASMYDMPACLERDYTEWIWVPPGFAHGNFFTEDSQIEYLCTGEYSPGCEAGISPLAKDINWSLADGSLKKEFDSIAVKTTLMTDKDRDGFSLKAWLNDDRSGNFIYGKC
ncbi:MAG: dTDP-4-dehydrorhamnose 3,5-epimerase family protein [Deltaproteobacteria bacterium]|nr:dTDP-4-dehydrorhamnose 3,5-epimerase family protein [Deltaproteobacteria bacterium]